MQLLGKRRRRSSLSGSGSDSGSTPSSSSDRLQDAREAQAVFRRHFEARFRTTLPAHPSIAPAIPLPLGLSHPSDPDSDPDASSSSSWSGFPPAASIPTTDHSKPSPSNPSGTSASASSSSPHPLRPSRSELRAFFSQAPLLPPLEPASPSPRSKPGKSVAGAAGGEGAAATRADPQERLNLRHDRALQQLLSESHLLAGPRARSTASTLKPSPASGVLRHKLMNHRLDILTLARRAQSDSISASRAGTALQPQSVPLQIRRGIREKAARLEKSRRVRARENGVVLERFGGDGADGVGGVEGRLARKAAGRGKGKGKGKGVGSGGAGGFGGGSSGKKEGERGGVGDPGVGKFRGGLLTLSRRDVVEIQGRDGGGKKGGKAGRERRRRRSGKK